MAGKRMDTKLFLISLVLIILLITSSISGCFGSVSGNSTTVTPVTTGNVVKVQAVVTNDTIHVSGIKTDSASEVISTDFQLDEGAYIVSWENTGNLGNIFTSSLDEGNGNGLYLVSLIEDTKGSGVLVVGDVMTPAGMYHLNVGNGGTYAVTITKPISGDAIPMTMPVSKGSSAAKAVQLNPGVVKINVKHDVAPDDTTILSLYDLNGNSVLSEWVQQSDGTSKELTDEISAAGIYILSATYSHNTGGEITISQ